MKGEQVLAQSHRDPFELVPDIAGKRQSYGPLFYQDAICLPVPEVAIVGNDVRIAYQFGDAGQRFQELRVELHEPLGDPLYAVVKPPGYVSRDGPLEDDCLAGLRVSRRVDIVVGAGTQGAIQRESLKLDQLQVPSIF